MAKGFVLSILFLVAVTVNANPLDQTEEISRSLQDLQDILVVVKDRLEGEKEAIEERNSYAQADEKHEVKYDDDENDENDEIDGGRINKEDEKNEYEILTTEEEDHVSPHVPNDIDDLGISNTWLQNGEQTVIQEGKDHSQYITKPKQDGGEMKGSVVVYDQEPEKTD